MLSSEMMLQNRYRVIRPLGRGGMGAVYEAFDERLSRTVALKETLVETDELRRAFGREARLLANLRHPALPKVLDHFDEAGGLFLVMEFIPGEDLGRQLETGRALAPAEVLGWAEQLLDALEYLHGLRPPVLHRDIKPSNLKIVSPGHVVLLDFGLAKGNAGQMTATGGASLLGYSPAYSPLEQMQGTGTDERSDLYSLAATLYHLLTGVSPTDALSRATAVVNGRPDPLRPPHQLNQGVSVPVSAALMRAMALDIESRPRNASEMREQMRGTVPRAAHTVPTVDDEITKVGVAPRRTDLNVAASVSQRRPGPPVVVPVPEETWVAKRQGGGTKRWAVGAVLLVGLVSLSALLYIYFSGGQTGVVTQTNRPVVGVSPTLTPSPTPVENINLQPEVSVTPVAGPAELAARERLARKNIPFNEAAFARAVDGGDTETVDLFLAAGMSPDVRDGAGGTALFGAAARGRNDISRKLLGAGADVNARDTDGSTALMQSAAGGHQETTGVLLAAGADVNLRDNKGQTALMRAAARGHADLVRELLRGGARSDLRDRAGRDALALAEENDRSDVVDLLRKARAGRP